MLHRNCVRPKTSCLLVIDLQEKFGAAIPSFEAIAANTAKLVSACNELGVPVLVTEQYPQGLGKTVDALKACLGNAPVLEKTAFSCTGAEGFREKLDHIKPDDIIVCGIETHVCVNQTVHALLNAGYRVHCVVDALGSRTALDHETALRKMELAGAFPSTVEMCLFELLGDAKNGHFKSIQKLIK